VLSARARAQDTEAGAAAATDKFIREQMKSLHIPAVSLAVLRHGTPVLTRAYGVADREKNVAVTPKTPFRIASVSKQFLASATLLLVQDGKLRLSDPLSKHIEGSPETWKDITIRHLLSHTAGLVREGPSFRWSKIQPDADVIRSAYGVPLVFAPGEKFQYSNLGYFVIGEIIRTVSGVSWGEFVRRRIFDRCGMTDTYLTSDDIANRAVGYAYSSKSGERVDDSKYRTLRPSGAFLSTADDMAKWDTALHGDTILTAESKKRLWTATPLNNGTTTPYGLGWFVTMQRGSVRRVSHGGDQVGFDAYFLRGLEDGISVIYLANSDKADPAGIAREVARLYGAR
jgi:CubicO group peptidase (beta-lactamase class C family)